MVSSDQASKAQAYDNAIAMMEVSNLMAKYEYLAESLEWDRIVDEVFASEWRGDLSHLGTFTDKEEMRRIYASQTGVLGHGFIHMLATPYIEVDGDTAKGVWYCLCPGTSPGEKPNAFWVMVKYINDFVRENGKWKISHMRIVYYFATPYQDGWAKTRLMDGYDAGGNEKALRPVVEHWLPEPELN